MRKIISFMPISLYSFVAGLFLLTFIFMANISKSQTASIFKLISSAFKEGKPIPAKFTCDSSNISPALSWSGSPGKTKSFAIIMDDPDAPWIGARMRLSL